jgi:excisionase family DNA binding protein
METAAADRLQSAVLEHGSLLSVGQTAGVLGCSVPTVRRLISDGSLPACQLGGRPGRSLRVSTAILAQRIQGWTER